MLRNLLVFGSLLNYTRTLQINSELFFVLILPNTKSKLKIHHSIYFVCQIEPMKFSFRSVFKSKSYVYWLEMLYIFAPLDSNNYGYEYC